MTTTALAAEVAGNLSIGDRGSSPGLVPAPRRWRDFPIELVRLLEETYDIVSDGGTIHPEWDDVLFQMGKWMPGLGIEPWDDYEMPGLRRMQQHIREYRAADMPWDGVAPHGLRRMPLSSMHCVEGHLIAGDNLYLRRNGRRECRCCRKSRDKRWWKKVAE